MRIAIAQMNPTVGKLKANKETALEAAGFAQEEGADLVVFPAHALTGWPLKGLGDSISFVAAAQTALQEFALSCPVPALISCPAAVQGYDGSMTSLPELFIIDGNAAHSLGVPMLEQDEEGIVLDINGEEVQIVLDDHFMPGCGRTNATLLLEMTADAFDSGYCAPAAHGELDRVRQVSKECCAYIATCNLVGAADTIVFGGGSLVMGPDGTLITSASITEQELIVFDINEEGNFLDGRASKYQQDIVGMMWDSAVMATENYVHKNGFTDVVIGLSGGIDSAVTAAVAVDALGSKMVHGVLMPSPFSSEGSVKDSLELADNLGIDTVTLPIDKPVEAFHEMLAEACGGEVSGLAAENLQARVRTMYLMTLSNAHGWMVLNTGNKSEAAMGFSTLYGDTAGAYAPLGNLYKTQVYTLAKYRASKGASIPKACIEKAPSAELYPGAKDEDRLPPYELLDQILELHFEGGQGAAQIVRQGFDADMVEDVLRKVTINEYKRRNEPIGPRLGGVCLNEDRDWPITNGWKDAR